MANDDLSPAGSARFPTTAWSCLQLVQDHGHADHVPAVNRFLTLYWKPAYYFLRVRGVPHHEAEDLTQEVLLRFLEKDLVGKADPQRGRFRSYLLGVLKHMLADQQPGRLAKGKRLERGFLSIHALIGDEERAFEPATHETPEEVFHRQLASTLWETVLGNLQQRLVEEGRAVWYAIFMAYLAPEGKRPSQEALAAQHGLSRDDVRALLPKVEKRLDRLLRAELREQGTPEPEIDDEIRELKRLLSRES
jgi:RNA polymerase sigma-70 factor (ECF subfamily)